jgi:hypothetical protein
VQKEFFFATDLESDGNLSWKREVNCKRKIPIIQNFKKET